MAKDRRKKKIYNLVLAFFVVFACGLFIGKGSGFVSAYVEEAFGYAGKKADEITLLSASNDVYADTQWSITNPGYYPYYGKNGRTEHAAHADVDLDVDDAWAYMQQEDLQRKEVIVAIIDTGIDYMHPDLSEHIWVNPGEIPGDGIDNDQNGYIDDIYGWDFYNDDATVCHYQYNKEKDKYTSSKSDNDDHGTHIAGIIAALSDNGIGIAGIASKIDIKIMILKINGGPNGSGNIENAVKAVRYATMMGADICNISWGTYQESAELKRVIRESDMLFVAAAGNTGADNNTRPIYPACFDLDNIISVAFIDPYGKLTKQSNYGSQTVDLAAPGKDIYSTIVGDYAYMSGSSMAAPHVTAIAALLYSYNDNLYPQNVRKIILENIKKLPDLEDKIINPGIPNAGKIVRMAQDLERDARKPSIHFETIYNKEMITIPVNAGDEGGAGIRVIRWLYGKARMDDFKRGTEGNRLEENQLTVTKAGTYTFYISDYAGNELLTSYHVHDDKTAPKITAGLKVSGLKKSVIVTAEDSLSKVKEVRYLEGKKSASYFIKKNAGQVLNLKNGTGEFKVKKEGYYTIYAIDYRGNYTVKVIHTKTLVHSG